MARFILDVDTNDIKQVLDILNRDEFLSDNVSSISCIDKTNDNQFYCNDASNGHTYLMNQLSDIQINTFKEQLIKIN